MAKAKGTTSGDSFLAELDQRLISAFNSLSAEDKAELEIMSLEEKISALEFTASIIEANAAVKNVTFEDVESERENITILTPGGFGLRAGTTITAYLQGTYHVFAKTLKENWKEFVTAEGDMYYYNFYYRFRDANGKIFGIWGSPTLSILQKLPTNSSAPMLVGSDPLVSITYVGKVEGKEILKQEYGIELTKGNAAHVFVTQVAQGVVYDRYVKGCVNNLNPVSPSTKAKSSLSAFEASKLNYEKIMALQNGSTTDIAKVLAQ
jgi:hypothetical protein